MRKGVIHLNKNIMLVTIILIAMHQFFYLVPNSIMGILYDYYLFAFCLIIFIIFYFKYSKTFFCGKFKVIILFIPLLVILSSFMAKINYDQGILLGIFTQRAWIATMFLYFPLMQMIIRKKITLIQLEKILYFVVTIELIIYFVQFIVGPSKVFLHVNNNIRYDTLRLYCNVDYMLLLMIISIDKLLQRKKIFKNLLYIIFIFSYILIVNKGRGASATFLIAAAITIIFSKSEKIYKIFILITSGLVGVNYLIKSESINEFISILFEGKADATLSVRLNSQLYFLEKWKSSWLSIFLGYGYPNSNLINSNIATGATQGFLLADNGMYGFLMCYGILGMLLYFIYIIKFLNIAIKILIKKQDAKLMALLVATLSGIATSGSFFITFYSFETVLIMIFIELILRNYEKIN